MLTRKQMSLAKNTFINITKKREKKKNLRLASVSFLVVIYIKRNLFGLRSDVTNGKKVNKIYKIRRYEVQPSCSHTLPLKKEKWREGASRFSLLREGAATRETIQFGKRARSTASSHGVTCVADGIVIQSEYSFGSGVAKPRGVWGEDAKPLTRAVRIKTGPRERQKSSLPRGLPCPFPGPIRFFLYRPSSVSREGPE